MIYDDCGRKCINCKYRDENPCKPCYKNEHILG